MGWVCQFHNWSCSLGSDFNIRSWPVANRCKGCLQDLISTHNIQPLPVYDNNHVLIPPLQYESKLKGAFIEVHVAICHNRIKSKKHDVFNAVLRELIVLSPRAAMPNSPKASNVTASTLNLAQNNVTKRML
ncbi:hypothetical protein M405DRAFT_219443 [Rhizopogon salebrosus TDB-379]|nr:hypothetical protein M405DRAFT_219443 [Rhizopogon salebrosus TDB-379]